MKQELVSMLKRISTIDIIIVLIIALTSVFIENKLVMMTILGFAVALINFILSSFITYYIMQSENPKYSILTLISLIFRVLIVAGIGVLIFYYSKIYIIAYVLGYSLHSISLVLYGISGNKSD